MGVTIRTPLTEVAYSLSMRETAADVIEGCIDIGAVNPGDSLELAIDGEPLEPQAVVLDVIGEETVEEIWERGEKLYLDLVATGALV